MKTLLLSLGLLAALPSAHAADYTVKMLNSGKDGPMAFEPSYVRAEVGDTVTFVPAEVGAHTSTSLLTPAGATSWHGAPDKEVKVKLDKEGVYLYVCDPHKMMGMVGVIQAGKPLNLAEAKTTATKEAASFALGKTRFETALAQVK